MPHLKKLPEKKLLKRISRLRVSDPLLSVRIERRVPGDLPIQTLDGTVQIVVAVEAVTVRRGGVGGLIVIGDRIGEVGVGRY
jgi:hypothetical protein